MENKHFSFNYHGIINHAFLIAVSDILYSSLSPLLGPRVFKSAFFVTNEMIQNIYFYSECDKGTDGDKNWAYGQLEILLSEHDLTISTSNCIGAGKWKQLSEKLEHYNSLTLDELKALKKEIIRNSAPEDSKGGGIGLIEVIRKSGNPLNYEFQSNDSEKGKITLTTKLNLGD